MLSYSDAYTCLKSRQPAVGRTAEAIILGRRAADMSASSGRRSFLGQALTLPALIDLGEGARAATTVAGQIKPGSLSVVCVGAHPDDPESGCGGTLAMYAAQGHRVTVIYLTRGERGIPGKS